MRFLLGRHESPEEARQHRLCRKMLGLPPETGYRDVLPGLATLGALGALLLGVVAWRLGHLQTIASALTGALAFIALGAAILQIHRRYLHAAAGVLVLAMLLGLLAAAIHRQGYLAPAAVVAGPAASALANSTPTR